MGVAATVHALSTPQSWLAMVSDNLPGKRIFASAF